MQENINAPEVEPETSPVAEAVAETKVEAKKEETISEILGTQEEPKKEVKMVPEAVLLDVKRELKELKKSIKEGTSEKKEVNATLKDLADKYSLDSEFLSDLKESLMADLKGSESKSEVEEKLTSKLQALEDKERLEKIDAAFQKGLGKALEQAPEYEKIVNKEVIKALSLDPRNANKTINQLIDEAYGHLVVGKRTIEPANGSSRNDNTIDMDKVNTDKEYLKKVLADPVLKKQYNEGLVNRLSSVL